MPKATLDQAIARFWAKVDVRGPDECWEWQGAITGGGYGNCWMRDGYYQAHRIAYMLGKGPIPTGLLVCHTCDNRRCCNPAHHFLGTHQDNCNDKIAKGRARYPDSTANLVAYRAAHPDWTRGENNPAAKLTVEQVREIRARYVPGNGGALAAEYGIGLTAVCNVAHRRTWRHVE